MDTTTLAVKNAYDKAVLEEYKRLNSSNGNTEFEKVAQAIHRFVSPQSTIFDIGCGPGKYVEYLLKNDFRVGCLDISKKSIQFLNRKIKNYHNKLLFSEVGCACDIELLGLGNADALLLLGPMYHLINPNSRKKALKNCHQVLRENGILITMFLNTLPIFDRENFSSHQILEMEIHENHITTWTNYKGEKIPQYRCTPENAFDELSEFFQCLEIVFVDEKKEQFFIISQKKSI